MAVIRVIPATLKSYDTDTGENLMFQKPIRLKNNGMKSVSKELPSRHATLFQRSDNVKLKVIVVKWTFFWRFWRQEKLEFHSFILLILDLLLNFSRRKSLKFWRILNEISKLKNLSKAFFYQVILHLTSNKSLLY